MRIRYRLEDIDTREPELVADLVVRLHQEVYSGVNVDYIREAFKAVADMFAGNYQGYLPMDTKYHDLEHTLQATLCYVRLMINRHYSQAKPTFTAEDFSLGIYAILLHDMGYLKKEDDIEGTGAKYTHTHEIRSCKHAQKYLSELGWSNDKITYVQNLIQLHGSQKCYFRHSIFQC